MTEAWRAVALTPTDKPAKFRNTLSQYAERVLLGKTGIYVGLAGLGIGAGCVVACAVGLVLVAPLARTEDRVWFHNEADGTTHRGIPIAEAPQYYGPNTDHRNLLMFLHKCEAWVPETVKQDHYWCKLMMRADQQERYEDERKKPTSPEVYPGANGHVDIDNERWIPGPRGKDGTRSYRILYDRTVWVAGRKESVQPWTGEVVWQYHPERKMTDQDRDKNEDGFQAISFTFTPDRPDTTPRAAQ